MLGYPSSHASFPTLEVMASNHYHLKQVGYLAATHSFTHDTDVIILVTNLIKKVRDNGGEEMTAIRAIRAMDRG